MEWFAYFEEKVVMSRGTLSEKNWDVVVIGGGPAGMMAAARAAERGREVLLLEKNDTLGKKLLITGGGRCNVTNNKPDIRTMLAKYKGSDKFLFSAFTQFAVPEALEFFHSRGMPTKEENEGRMFPVSNKAQSVWNVLVESLRKSSVKVQPNAEVTAISRNDQAGVFTVMLRNKTRVTARSCVIATGGTSHPETGSTGDGYKWLRSFRHTIKENDFALVPIAIKDAWIKKLGGVTLPMVKLSVYQNGLKQDSQKGKILFTHFGISGPTVLNMSRDIGELLQYGEVEIVLDLFPSLDPGALKRELQSLLVSESNKKLKNTLGVLVPKALVEGVLSYAGIDGETANHSVSSADRVALVTKMKAISLQVDGLLGADKAVVSSGGVVPEEIDFRTMQSRLVPGLYVIGDMLNIERPSGGYSLQLCWTTGYLAGSTC